MPTITIGDHDYSVEEVIAAIAASNDEPEEEAVEATTEETSCSATTTDSPLTVAQLYEVLKGFAYRLETLEDRLPFTSAGFGVVKTPLATGTRYRVQTLNQMGQTIVVTFEVPN